MPLWITQNGKVATNADGTPFLATQAELAECCCCDLADEYALTLSLRVWHIPDAAKFFDGDPPPAPATFVRSGAPCEWVLDDTRTRSFDKLTPAGAACKTANDGGVIYTLRRDAGKTRWEVYEGSILFGYNDDPDDPVGGTWQSSTAVDGYAASYTDNDATPCGWSTSTMHIDVLTIEVL